MSAQEYDRWYILPPTDDPDEPGVQPKYSDRDGIRGFAGNTVSAPVIGDSYAGLVAQYDHEQYYIVRLYGTWAALNGISVLGDTRNLATNPQDVVAVLNQRFPGLGRTGVEWSEAFLIQ